MNTSHDCGPRQLGLSDITTFDLFCTSLDLKEAVVLALKKSLKGDDQYIDLGQEHGGCMEVRLGWDHLRRVGKEIREKQIADAARKAKARKNES